VPPTVVSIIEFAELIYNASSQLIVVTVRDWLAPHYSIRYSGRTASAGISTPVTNLWLLLGIVDARRLSNDE
jgi:hypothetical protein